MPAALSYPGVYVQEIPSGVRTITGVPTSITAFVGRAAAGPTDDPVEINGFADYERQFGGLDLASPMSYAVQDFYLNGGSRALIVRVVHSDARAAIIRLRGDVSPAGDLVLVGSSKGAWTNQLIAAVDYDTDAALPNISPLPFDPDQRFNLTVRYLSGPDTFVEEKFNAVSTQHGDPRYLSLVLERQSAYVRVLGDMPAHRPKNNVTGEGSKRNITWIRVDRTSPTDSGTDGQDIDDGDLVPLDPDQKTGIYALNKANIFNLLCIPPLKRVAPSWGQGNSELTMPTSDTYNRALELCVQRRAMLIVDPDPKWAAPAQNAVKGAIAGRNNLLVSGPNARNAALYFPCVREFDRLRNSRLDTFVPCGIVAGVIARTDVARGVWKAPAGLDATLNGVQDLQVNLNDPENGSLNPLGINCLRSFNINGRLVWGARTMRGADESADEYKYLPVRRLALYLEESLYRGTQWVVFEPNDEPLWAQVRLNVGAFMQGLFRQGAFQGTKPSDAYFVKCDSQTTTQNDINLGILNIVVGFAPLKPAEFVVIQIQQMPGQIPT
jgi:uncharacterized protein